MRDDTLLAQEVDPDSFDFIGDPRPIAQGVGNNSNNSRAGFAISRNGVLAYRHRLGLAGLVWFSRSGSPPPQLQSDIQIAHPALSPDGRRVAGERRTSNAKEASDIWIQDIAHKTESRFTTNEREDRNPVWSPDGRRLVFSSNRDGGKMNLFLKSAGGAESEELLLKTDFDKLPTDWSADGRYIIYQEFNPKSQWDIWLLPVNGNHKPIPYIQGDFAETSGCLSPDGRWMAYVSDETGRSEIYVQTMPTSGNKWKLTNDGGSGPRWNRNGRELFYVGPADLELMALEVTLQGAPNKFDVGPAQQVFRAQILGYDVSSDGQQFLVRGAELTGSRSSLSIVTNWQDILLSKRRFSTQVTGLGARF